MAKRKPETVDLPQWDAGTYQTGSTTPPKRVSGPVTVLLLLVIFLGGIASGLGLVNFKLIQQLSSQPGVTIAASQGEYTLPLAEDSIFSSNQQPAPAIPKNRSVQLQLQDSPYYSNNVSGLALENSQQIYEHNQNSLAEIYSLTYSHSTVSGVGLILTEDGYLLTNAHLVEAAKRIFVYLPDGRMLPAAVVGSDSLTDMAVLYVDAQNLTPATFGTSKTLQVADPIYTISLHENAKAPMRMHEGSLFFVSRKFSTAHYSLNLLQTCHHSESGPMFNSFGHVVGLCVSHVSQYFKESDNLGMVLGSNSMQAIIDQLVEKGYVSGRPDLGFAVESVSKLFQHYWNLPGGLLVSGIHDESEPAKQGLRNGDILLALNGKSLLNRDDLYTVLYSCSIGQEVTAVVFRDGIKTTVTLTVSELGA